MLTYLKNRNKLFLCVGGKTPFLCFSLFVFDKNNMVVDEVNLISGTDAKKENFKELLEKLVKVW